MDYVSRILSYRQGVEALFQSECLDRRDAAGAMALERERLSPPPDPAQIAKK
jgi:hypothetical protein